MLRILVVDDHEIMRKGLVSIFGVEKDCEIVGEAAGADEAFGLIEKLAPDIVLMDIRMPGIDGSKATTMIRGRYPEVKVIALTAVDDEDQVIEIIENGVHGYILKSTSPTELVRAVRDVAGGDSYLHPQIARTVMERMRSVPPTGDTPSTLLSSREVRVLHLMAEGCKNREIADKLFLSEETVKTHVSNILTKLGQADRVQAVLYAIRQKILRLENS